MASKSKIQNLKPQRPHASLDHKLKRALGLEVQGSRADDLVLELSLQCGSSKQAATQE